MSKMQTILLLLALAAAGTAIMRHELPPDHTQDVMTIGPELTEEPLTLHPFSKIGHAPKGLDSWASSAWSLPAVKKAK